jgi:thermitase
MDGGALAGLSGSWGYSYGGKQRRLEVDPWHVAVRASREAEQAVRSAVSRGYHGSERINIEHLTHELEHALDEVPGTRDRELFTVARHSGLFSAMLFPERFAALYRRHLRPLLEYELPPIRLARLDEMIAELLNDGDPELESAFRGAASGAWLRLPRPVVAKSPLLLRSTGALALPVQGTDRLLSDQVFVRFFNYDDTGEMQRALRQHDLTMLMRLPFDPRSVIASVVRREGDSFNHLRYLLIQPPREFETIEPVFYEAIGPRTAAHGHHYQRQWQSPKTKLETAWVTTQGQGVRIAIIDNGINIRHPDLAPGIQGGGWYESTSSGGVRFTSLTAQSGQSFPTGHHGTFCCGMAAARGNNNGGVWGAAPGAGLVPIVCVADQLTTQATLARAIAYAADPSMEQQSGVGADIVSCSLGPGGDDWPISLALDLALRFVASSGRGGKGCPVFWAASNGTVDITKDEVASHQHVLAVSRSNDLDCYDGAAYGTSLAFVAPGRDVYSTTENGYDFDTGCSFATPLAAGIGALVLAVNPDFSARDVGEKLKQTCDKVGGVAYDPSGFHPELGFGRVNAADAVK